MSLSLYDLLALYVTWPQQSITNVSVTFVRMITERNDYFIIFFFFGLGGWFNNCLASERNGHLPGSFDSINKTSAQLQMLLLLLLLPSMSISAALYLLD